jgi:hypothetical protein
VPVWKQHTLIDGSCLEPRNCYQGNALSSECKLNHLLTVIQKVVNIFSFSSFLHSFFICLPFTYFRFYISLSFTLARSVQRLATGWKPGFNSSVGHIFVTSSHIDSVAHSVYCYPTDIAPLTLVKTEAGHSPPSSAKIKKVRSHTLLLHRPS